MDHINTEKSSEQCRKSQCSGNAAALQSSPQPAHRGTVILREIHFSSTTDANLLPIPTEKQDTGLQPNRKNLIMLLQWRVPRRIYGSIRVQNRTRHPIPANQAPLRHQLLGSNPSPPSPRSIRSLPRGGTRRDPASSDRFPRAESEEISWEYR